MKLLFLLSSLDSHRWRVSCTEAPEEKSSSYGKAFRVEADEIASLFWGELLDSSSDPTVFPDFGISDEEHIFPTSTEAPEPTVESITTTTTTTEEAPSDKHYDFETEEGFDAVKYSKVCVFDENVDPENRKIIPRSNERRSACRKYTKIMHKSQVEHHFAHYIVAQEEDEETQSVETNMLGDFVVGMENDPMISQRPQIDPRCEEEEEEELEEEVEEKPKKAKKGCCSRGKFYENDTVWEYAQKGLKTVCGCSSGEILCEEPTPDTMVQRRSRCSLRSNWYVKKIQKMSMMRDPQKDGNIVIKSLVGVEGYKIRNNEIFSYMRLNCDGGEFYYDGESIGDTFDFECSIMKGKSEYTAMNKQQRQRVKKQHKLKKEVERGSWRKTPECRKISDGVETESVKESNKIEEAVPDNPLSSFDSISARILGGTKVAGNGEYPWQCLLITSDGSYCGCVVVDSKMILTAAHCVVTASEADGATFENGKPKSLIALVIMGSNDRLSDSSQRIRTTVCGVHPGFKTDGPIMYYDIAFCQLKTPIILDDPKAPVQPACLPGTLELNEERKQKMCVATGFGTTSKDSGPSNHMMSAIVPLWVYSSCRKLYNNKLSKVHMCAGGLGTDTCQGDSGGALQCRIPVSDESYRRCKGWFVRGITSFGKGCNLLGQPGVYVDLSNRGILNWVHDWIKVLRNKDLDPNRLRTPRKILDNMKTYLK